MISFPPDNPDWFLIDRTEKIVLLDPMRKHSCLCTLCEDNLLVSSSVYDCFSELASNPLQNYTLFLSLATFADHSLQLSRLSNVSFFIFYEDNDQPHPQISKTKYNLRLMFPKARLLEYLRHAVILNYAKQAHMYRLQSLEREADEYFLAASRESRILADDFEEQSSTPNGREPKESIPYDNENTDDLILRSSIFLSEH